MGIMKLWLENHKNREFAGEKTAVVDLA